MDGLHLKVTTVLLFFLTFLPWLMPWPSFLVFITPRLFLLPNCRRGSRRTLRLGAVPAADSSGGPGASPWATLGCWSCRCLPCRRSETPSAESPVYFGCGTRPDGGHCPVGKKELLRRRKNKQQSVEIRGPFEDMWEVYEVFGTPRHLSGHTSALNVKLMLVYYDSALLPSSEPFDKIQHLFPPPDLWVYRTRRNHCCGSLSKRGGGRFNNCDKPFIKF